METYCYDWHHGLRILIIFGLYVFGYFELRQAV
jgi:hypothetical protein